MLVQLVMPVDGQGLVEVHLDAGAVMSAVPVRGPHPTIQGVQARFVVLTMINGKQFSVLDQDCDAVKKINAARAATGDSSSEGDEQKPRIELK